jgi:L-fuconolactonase
LPVVLELLKAVPTLRGVIDHIAKPDIAHAIYHPWKAELAAIAEYRNIYCKVSGMVTEAHHQQWRPSDFDPYVRHVLDVFGADRVMYGSDWPVCLLAATYDQVWQLAENSLPATLTQDDRAAIFGNNAADFYKLLRCELRSTQPTKG